MALEFVVEPNPAPASDARVAEVLEAPGFGRVFTDHLAIARWTSERGWHDAKVAPYGPLSMDPATHVFHYSQTIFEGFKAYLQPDGSIATFRPHANGERFNRSAARMALPSLPVEDFVAASDLLVRTDGRWVPSQPGMSLYLRPLMMATEVGLGVRPANDVTFLIIASPAASYFTGGAKPVSIWVSEEYTRAAPGGTGAAKTGGNYAASLIAQQEAIANGCEQVLFLDAVERRWVEELGGMNVWVVLDDGSLITPELSGSILQGVTRDTIITLLRDLGRDVEERRIDIDEIRKGIESGRVVEVFACGTAAVVSSIGRLAWTAHAGEAGEVALPTMMTVADEVRSTLVAVQEGRAPDPHGWLHRVP
jgi:branched-chain amino acid aminotransferase